MKVLNNINIDFNFEGTRVYELTIECVNNDEVNTAFDKLGNQSGLTIDCFEDNDVNVMCEAWKYQTKQDFIKEVRSLLK